MQIVMDIADILLVEIGEDENDNVTSNLNTEAVPDKDENVVKDVQSQQQQQRRVMSIIRNYEKIYVANSVEMFNNK